MEIIQRRREGIERVSHSEVETEKFCTKKKTREWREKERDERILRHFWLCSVSLNFNSLNELFPGLLCVFLAFPVWISKTFFVPVPASSLFSYLTLSNSLLFSGLLLLFRRTHEEENEINRERIKYNEKIIEEIYTKRLSGLKLWTFFCFPSPYIAIDNRKQ